MLSAIGNVYVKCSQRLVPRRQIRFVLRDDFKEKGYLHWSLKEEFQLLSIEREEE